MHKNLRFAFFRSSSLAKISSEMKVFQCHQRSKTINHINIPQVINKQIIKIERMQ